MKKTIQIRLFANLSGFTPDDAAHYPIVAGTTVSDVMQQLGVPMESAKLIFIDGRKGAVDSVLSGGERVGIFPPVAGG